MIVAPILPPGASLRPEGSTSSVTSCGPARSAMKNQFEDVFGLTPRNRRPGSPFTPGLSRNNPPASG